MGFAFHIIMVAIHRFHIGGEGLFDDRAHGGNQVCHHHVAVLAREILRPADGLDVVVEMRAGSGTNDLVSLE
jgi:hypothetical protein